MNKVLISCPKSKHGGVYSFVENITPFLKSKVVYFYRGRDSRINSAFLQILSNLYMPLLFIKKVFISKPEAVIINTSLSYSCLLRDGVLVVISKLFRKKVLLIIHGFEEEALSFRRLIHFGYFQANAMIVLAEEFKKKIEECGYKRKVYTQYNPVSVSLLKNSTPLEIEKIEDIVFISRIERAKGIYILLDTFNLIKKDYPEIRLHIAGNGTEKQSIVKYIDSNNLKDVILYDFISGDDKSRLLANSDIFIFPTFYKEGLPISVLESMSYGQIVITRPVAGLVDLYKSCPFGILIDSLDPMDFKNAFDKIVADKETFIRMRNIQFAKENFHPEKIANRIEHILETL